MNYTLSLLLLCFISTSLSAQSPLWSAEVKVEVTTEFEHENEHRNYQLLRRPQLETVGKSDEYAHEPMGVKIMRSVLEGRAKLYKDESLSQPYSLAEIEDLFSSRDTIAVINTETYEEVIQIVYNEADPTEFGRIQLRLQLEYQADGSMQQRIRCASFLIDHYDELGNELTDGPRVYFPLNTASRPLKFNRRNWNLIDQHMINIPFNEMELGSTNQLETVEMISDLMEKVIRSRNDNFVGVVGDYEVLNLEDRQALRGSVDTIVTYSPVSYEEQKEVVVNVYDPASISKIRLLHYWAWNEKKAELTILPIGYAPIKAVHDEYGNFLYSLPLFYHVDDRFRE